MKQISEKTLSKQFAIDWPAREGLGRFQILVLNISKVMDKIAGFAIMLTMLLIVANILMRVLFNSPILGTGEMVGFLTAGAIGLSLALCALQNGHIAIDLLVDSFPAPIRVLVDIMIQLVVVIFLGACSWGLMLLANSNAASGLVSSTIQIPVYPFIYLVAFGFFIFALAQLTKLMDILGKGGR